MLSSNEKALLTFSGAIPSTSKLLMPGQWYNFSKPSGLPCSSFQFLGSAAVSLYSDEGISFLLWSSNVLCCCVRNDGGIGGLGRTSPQREEGVFLQATSTCRVKHTANVSPAFEFCHLEQLAG